jgi:acetyl-CoA carboxylase biotin carboxyl carrier protein
VNPKLLKIVNNLIAFSLGSVVGKRRDVWRPILPKAVRTECRSDRGAERVENLMARTKVEAEVTGRVWKVVANSGDAVQAQDPILIVESMKMEIPVVSPCDGRLAEVLVQEGDPVAEGQVVAEVE